MFFLLGFFEVIGNEEGRLDVRDRRRSSRVYLYLYFFFVVGKVVGV